MKRFALILMVFTLISCKGASEKQIENSDELTSQQNSEQTETFTEPYETTTSGNPAATETVQKDESNLHDFTHQINHREELSLVTSIGNADSGLSELFSYFDQPLQTFSIDPSKDTVITGEQGTIISILRNSFVFKDSQTPVTGEISITLKEYYRISDMVLANLSTMSNGEILETGGMIYLEATANNEEVELRPDASIELKFPTQNKKDDMLLWYGSWDESGMNWELAEQATEMSERIYHNTDLEEPAQFPGGDAKLNTFFRNNLKYPNDAIEIGVQGNVFTGFVVDKDGRIKDIEILRGLHPSIDNEVVRAMEIMPPWNPGTINGNPVSSRITIPVMFRLNGGSTENRASAENFEQIVSDETIHDINIEDIRRYVFSTQQLGWVNVDKIINNRNPRIDFTVDLRNNSNTTLRMILRDYNSILIDFGRERRNYVFHSVPINLHAKLVAIKYDNNQYYIATKDIQIRRNYSPKLEFQLVTMAKLKEIIEELNEYSR